MPPSSSQSRTRAFPRGNQTAGDTTLGWRFPTRDSRRCSRSSRWGRRVRTSLSAGNVSREEQDAFALRSQKRWAAANAAGRFDDELVAVGDVTVDEHARPEDERRGTRSAEAGVSRGRHRDRRECEAASTTVRPRSSSRARRRRGELGIQPLGAFVASAAVKGVDPRVHGHRAGPCRAQPARARGDRREPRLDLVELNEAFASQSGRRDQGARPRRREGERERRSDCALAPATG